MKKRFLRALSLILLVALLAGCGRAKASSSETSKTSDKLQIVCTIFPEYDWVRQILGEAADYAEVTLLLDQGVDLHSFQPTAENLITISNCDLLLYVGGASDAWVEAALRQTANPDRVEINLLDVLGDAVKQEEFVEGMEQEEQPGAADSINEQPEQDEHVWLSLKNVRILCTEISAGLSEIDPAHAEHYADNLKDYTEQLETLDAAYRQAVDDATFDTLVFADRFPFRYLADDYGLDYYAAFPGCSAETEAGFETVTFLAKKVDALRLSSIMTIEGAQHKIAQTVVENTKEKNQVILEMNSMQSTTMQDVQNGTSYLSIMESNLQVLKKALNE